MNNLPKESKNFNETQHNQPQPESNLTIFLSKLIDYILVGLFSGIAILAAFAINTGVDPDQLSTWTSSNVLSIILIVAIVAILYSGFEGVIRGFNKPNPTQNPTNTPTEPFYN